MTPEAIRDHLAGKLGAEIEWHEGKPGDPFAVVPSDRWLDACKLAREEDELLFDFLRAQTGTDYPDDGAIEVVSHLFSYQHRHALVLKTRVDRADPKLHTIEGVWPAANWYEREIFDLLGVHFENHSDLRHLVLPEDWVGHPLRKDYKEQDFYKGIPTTRPGYPKPEPKEKKKKNREGRGTAEVAESAEKKAEKKDEVE